MKRIITTVFAALILMVAETKATELVPVTIMQTFFETFAGAQNVQWEQKNGFNIASFTLNNVQQSAVYSEDGELIVVARQIGQNEISAKLNADLKERFEGFYATTIFEMKEGSVTDYFATVTNGSKEKILKANGNKWVVLKEKSIAGM